MPLFQSFNLRTCNLWYTQEDMMTNNQSNLNSESLDPNTPELNPIMANESDPNSLPNQVIPIVNILER